VCHNIWLRAINLRLQNSLRSSEYKKGPEAGIGIAIGIAIAIGWRLFISNIECKNRYR